MGLFKVERVANDGDKVRVTRTVPESQVNSTRARMQADIEASKTPAHGSDWVRANKA